MQCPHVQTFYEQKTATLSHVVFDPDSKAAAVIDPILDFDPQSGRTGTASANEIITFLQDQGLDLQWILETHVHADHITGAQVIQAACGGKTAMSNALPEVYANFAKLFDLPAWDAQNCAFDLLLQSSQKLPLGGLEIEVLATPGHTPACVSYLVGDALFVGDTLFAPDFGTARCDFPGGDARTLYTSIQKMLTLPDETRIFLCHDYMPGGRALVSQTTVGEQKAKNIHLAACRDVEEYVKMREDRDKTLPIPAFLIYSVQSNLTAGRLPEALENGIRYLKLPLDQL